MAVAALARTVRGAVEVADGGKTSVAIASLFDFTCCFARHNRAALVVLLSIVRNLQASAGGSPQPKIAAQPQIRQGVMPHAMWRRDVGWK
jgi:hypothetical protein